MAVGTNANKDTRTFHVFATKVLRDVVDGNEFVGFLVLSQVCGWEWEVRVEGGVMLLERRRRGWGDG